MIPLKTLQRGLLTLKSKHLKYILRVLANLHLEKMPSGFVILKQIQQ